MAATNSIDALFASPPAPTAPRGGDQASRAPGGEQFEPSLARALQAKPAERRSTATEKLEATEQDEAPPTDRTELPVARKSDSTVKKSPTDCSGCDTAADESEAAAAEDMNDDESGDDNQDPAAVIQQAASTQDPVPVAGVVQPLPPAGLIEVVVEGAGGGPASPAAATTAAGLASELPAEAKPLNLGTGGSQQAPAAEPIAELNATASPGSTDDTTVEAGVAAASTAAEPTAESPTGDAFVVAVAADAPTSSPASELADSVNSEADPAAAASRQDDSLQTTPTHASDSESEADQGQPSPAPAPLHSAAPSDSASNKQATPAAASDTQTTGKGEHVRRSDKGNSAKQSAGESASTLPTTAPTSAEAPAADVPTAPAAAVVAVTGASGTSRSATTIERLGNAQFAGDPAPHTEQDGATSVDRNRFLQRVEGAFKAAQQRDGRIHVRLSPPELGALRIEMVMQNGALTARIEAETPAARATLLDNLPALRERLAQQEIRIEKFDVDVRRDGGSAGGSSGQQSRDGQADQSSWRDNGGRPRNQPPRQQSTATPPRTTPALHSTTTNTGLDVRI